MSDQNQNLFDTVTLDRNINTSILHIFKVSGEELNLANKIEIEITSISTRGLKFKTFFYLDDDMNFYFELPLEDKTIYLIADIVNSYEEEEDYIYNCKFMHIDSNDKEVLNEYIEKHKKE